MSLSSSQPQQQPQPARLTRLNLLILEMDGYERSIHEYETQIKELERQLAAAGCAPEDFDTYRGSRIEDLQTEVLMTQQRQMREHDAFKDLVKTTAGYAIGWKIWDFLNKKA